MTDQCAGFPPGHECPVLVIDRDFCQSCTERYLRWAERKLPLNMAVPIGVVLQSLDALVLLCKCGGLADSPDHKHSLLHAEWAWAEAVEKMSSEEKERYRKSIVHTIEHQGLRGLMSGVES